MKCVKSAKPKTIQKFTSWLQKLLFCDIIRKMKKGESTIKYKGLVLPLIVEKGESGYYVIECPILEGCFTQGKTIDEALKNIREVIELVLPEKKNQAALKDYHPQELSFHTITL